MTVTAISLVDPVSGLSVAILPADGVAAQVLDVAAPARAVEEDRAGAHGTYDTTRYLTAAAVSLSMLLYPGVTQTPEKFLDALGPLLNPGLRPVLIVSNDQWDAPRQLTVRYDSKSAPLSDPTNWPVQVSWKAPAGVWEASNLASAVIGAFIASSVGFPFDVAGAVITSAGYVFPATTAPAPSQVVSAGNAPSQWTAFLYGPCTGPKWANDSAGAALEFTGDLTLGAGDYVALDSAKQTAYLNSDPRASVLGFLNFATSNWWLIQPGLNTLRYYPSSASPGAQATLSFRPAWLA
jgi:Siphovirus-type tail component, C-terminal domain